MIEIRMPISTLRPRQIDALHVRIAQLREELKKAEEKHYGYGYSNEGRSTS